MNLRVLSYNVWGWRPDFHVAGEAGLAAFLRASAADLVFLAEMRGGDGQIDRVADAAGFAWRMETPSYPHHTPRLAVGLLARDGVVESAAPFPLFFSKDGRHDAIRAVLRAPDGGEPWIFYGVHLWNCDHIGMSLAKLAGLELWRPNFRLEQAETLLRDAAGRGRVVMAGDFNTFPFSRAWRRLRRDLKDACPPLQIMRGTYRHCGLQARLDYIWSGRGLKARDYRVLDPGLSDHAAVAARLAANTGGV